MQAKLSIAILLGCLGVILAQIPPGIDSPEPKVQLEALAHLERQKYPELLPVLIAMLTHENQAVRHKVALVLGEWREPVSVPALMLRLKDPDTMVRGASAWALGQIGDEMAVAGLLPAIGDPSWEVRCSAMSALGNFPGRRDVCGKIEERLSDPSWQVRYTAALQLGKMKSAMSLPKLHEIIGRREEREEVLSAVCRALGEIGSPDSFSLLLEKIESEYPQVAGESDVALTRLAPRCRAQLLDIFEDRRLPMDRRYYVGLLLGRIGAREALPLLYRSAGDPEEHGKIRYISMVLLVDVAGKDALALFVENAASEDPWVQRGAIAALGRLREPETLPRLLDILRSSNPQLREEALSAVAAFDTGPVENFVLRELSRPSHDQLCLAAIRLAGTLKIYPAIPFLRKLQKQEQWQETATWALRQVGER